jgi:hypothetical protein
MSPPNYVLIVNGTPVWASNMSSPVRAYIARHKPDFGRIALFCTQGGSGGDKVLRRMAALCEQSPVATACFNDSEIDRGLHRAKLDAFVAALADQETA